MNDTIGITLRFSRDTMAIVDRQKVAFGCTSRSEVLRKAIALLVVADNAKKTGGRMAIMDRDGTRHFILGL